MGDRGGGAIANLAYPDDTGATGVELPPGAVDVGVIANGGANTTVAEFSDLTLSAGDRTILVAAGKLGATTEEPFQLIAIDTTSSPPLGSWTAAVIPAD